MGANHPGFSPNRFWSSPPEIYKAGSAGQTLAVSGKKFLIRSDFPVVVKFDTYDPITVGGPYAQYYVFEVGECDPVVTSVKLTFPVGWGTSSGGALVQSQILGRHGVLCIEALWTDDEVMLPNPDLLPTTTLTLSPMTGTAGNVNTNWGTVTMAASIFSLSGGRLPNEFYVKTVSIDVEHAATYPPLAGIYCYEWQLKKTNVPNADQQWFFQLTQPTPSVEHYMNNYKLPLRSIFAQYAAETPTLETTCFGTLDCLIAPVVHARLQGGYIL